MISYIFGGNTGVATPEDLASRRRWAQAMIRSGTERTPQDPWEGLVSIARAISGNYADYKAGQEETKQRGAADERFNALFRPRDAVVPAASGDNTAKVPPVSFLADEQVGAPGSRATAEVMPKPSERGAQFKTRMLNDPDLKLTPAIADGFIGNFDVETGGFKHMQEIKPVPGSRGGLGWGMWAGPRRVQLEAWAKQNGLDPGSDDASYGFWKHEMLNTPEGRRVLGALQGVDDPAKAAEIVSSQYLRPGIPHLDRRVAAAQRYAGGTPTIQPGGDTRPVRLAQAGGPSLSDMLQVYSDPWISPEQKSILQIYIDRELQKADPKSQLELKKLEAEVKGLTSPTPELTDNMREYEAARKQGFAGSFMDFILEVKKAGAKSGNLPEQSNLGTTPPRYRAVQDPKTGGWITSPVPGGPAETAPDAGQDADRNRQAADTVRRGLITQEVDRTLELMDSGILPDTGWGSVLSGLPGTDAKAISSLLGTIKANIGLAELNKMRQRSPTGASLGAVTEKELAYLQAIAGGLDQAQGADQLRDNLNQLWNAYQDVVHGQGRGPQRRHLSSDKTLRQPNRRIRVDEQGRVLQ